MYQSSYFQCFHTKLPKKELLSKAWKCLLLYTGEKERHRDFTDSILTYNRHLLLRPWILHPFFYKLRRIFLVHSMLHLLIKAISWCNESTFISSIPKCSTWSMEFPTQFNDILVQSVQCFQAPYVQSITTM